MGMKTMKINIHNFFFGRLMFNYYEHVRLHYVYKSKNNNHKHDVPFFQTIRCSVQTRCPDQ